MQRLQSPNDSIIFVTSGKKNPVARKLLQFSHNGLAVEDSNACAPKLDLLIFIWLLESKIWLNLWSKIVRRLELKRSLKPAFQ